MTRDADRGVLFVKLVNASPEPQSLDLKLIGAAEVKRDAKLITLKSKTKENTNTIRNPNNIVPVTTTIQGLTTNYRHVAPPYSIQVLEVNTK